MLVVWVVVAGGALLGARALDDPVGAGERDAAQPAVPGPVVTTPEAPEGEHGDQGGLAGRLPPLAVVLDRPLPAGLADLQPAEQAERLRALATADAPARRHVELGTVLQLSGDDDGAAAAYRRAIAIGGDEVAARVGLALVGATADPAAGQAAATQLERLARAHPRSQLVAFNQGWLEVYRRRGAQAAQALRRAASLGPGTRLGLTARALVEALENPPTGRNP